jgi:molybdate transport system permease protein
MAMTPTKHGKGFDVLMWTPLAAYLLLILGLLGAMMGRITWPAVRTAFSDEALLAAIRLSLETSFVSALLSVLVAIPAGYALSRSRFPGLAALDTVLDIPIVLPPLIIGLAVLIFFSTPFGRWVDRLNGPEGWIIYHPAGIVLVQFLIGAAIAVRVVKAGFDNVDERYENVAWTLGANRWQAFAKVAAPLVWPNVAAAAIISWARIFGLFGPVILVAGTMRERTEIMPTTIFLEISIGRLEVALVVGALMVAISMATLIAFKKIGGKGYFW